MISGPGCPVCYASFVASTRAVMLALDKKSDHNDFGDLIRVPGTEMTCRLAARANGQVVYSPLDSLEMPSGASR